MKVWEPTVSVIVWWALPAWPKLVWDLTTPETVAYLPWYVSSMPAITVSLIVKSTGLSKKEINKLATYV